MPTHKEVFNRSIRESFILFHRKNPHVYKLFEEQVTRKKTLLHQKGHKVRVSASQIMEWLRWEMPFRTDDINFKVNNSYKPYYARLYLAKHPNDDGLFEQRKLFSDPGPYMEIDGNGQLTFL